MKNLNLSNIKSKVKLFFKNLKIKDTIIIGLLITLSFMYGLYSFKSYKLDIANINLIAQSDSLRVYKNKDGENTYKIYSLIADKSQLKEMNSNLSKEIDKLSRKDKKNLVEINKLILTIDLLKDSMKVIVNTPTDSTYDNKTKLTTYNFELKDLTQFRKLIGTTKVISTNRPSSVTTYLTTDKVYTDLTIGKTLKNNKLELFVSSSNPGLVVNNMQGSVIDLDAYSKLSRKKRFGIGAQVGYGMTLHGFSPYVGIGLSYNIINF